MSTCPTCGLPSAFADPEHVADGHHRASRGVSPDDGRRHNLLVALTPSLLARIEALGFEVGSEGVLPWLVGKAEEMRAECDAFAIYRGATTTALGIEPSSCAEDVAEAVNEMRLTLAAEQAKAPPALPFEAQALASFYTTDTTQEFWRCLACGCAWPCDIVTACANCHGPKE